MSIDGSGASRAGGDGTHNEDAFRVDDGLGLYVVCDGASDSAAGEVAAQIASEAVAGVDRSTHTWRRRAEQRTPKLDGAHHASRTPFTQPELHLGMDLQLDVFVWRETAGERAERY